MFTSLMVTCMPVTTSKREVTSIVHLDSPGFTWVPSFPWLLILDESGETCAQFHLGGVNAGHRVDGHLRVPLRGLDQGRRCSRSLL